MSEIIKKLHEDPMFQRAIAGVDDEEQRKRIIGHTEAFVTQLNDALHLVLQKMKEDESLRSKLTEALTETLLSGSTSE